MAALIANKARPSPSSHKSSNPCHSLIVGTRRKRQITIQEKIIAMIRFTSSILAFSAALAAATASFAQDDATTVHVHYSDLNLNSPAGVAAFKSRVDRAVSEICGDRNEIGIGRQVVIQECWAAVAPRAHDQIATIISAAQDRRQLASAAPVAH